MTVLSIKILSVPFLLSILFSFNLSIPLFVQNSHGLLSSSISQTTSKNNPFESKPDQIIFDYFPSFAKLESHTSIDEMTNQMTSSLTQRITKSEICGDGQDNDGNALVDENCNVGLPSAPPQDDGQMNVPDNPSANLNTSKTLRLAVVGDIDSNSGLTAQLNLAKKYIHVAVNLALKNT